MWKLDCEESWALKNWCFWTVVLEKTLENPLDCKEIQPVHPKWDQSWMFIGRTDVEAETPILLPPHAKSWLIGKESDSGRDWGQEEKGTTQDEMAGWHHQFDGHEFVWTPGFGVGQDGLACCNSWGRKELDTTEWLSWTELMALNKNMFRTQLRCQTFMRKSVKEICKSFPRFQDYHLKTLILEREREQGHKYLLARNHRLFYLLCISLSDMWSWLSFFLKILILSHLVKTQIFYWANKQNKEVVVVSSRSSSRLWCWEGLGAGGDEDDRGWDGWMASLTQWTWVWVNSGNWWWIGRPGVLRFMRSQRVGHDWTTELNWTELSSLKNTKFWTN